MRRRELAIGVCVCLTALVTSAMAQRRVESTQAIQPTTTNIQTGVIPAEQPADFGVARQPSSATQRIQPPLIPAIDFGGGAASEDNSGTVERKVNELVGKWKAAQNESDRGKVQQELRTALKAQFHANFTSHEKEIKQLEAEVQRLREHLELRRKKQDEIVESRVQQLLREAQGLGWGTQPTPQAQKSKRLQDDPFARGRAITDQEAK